MTATAKRQGFDASFHLPSDMSREQVVKAAGQVLHKFFGELDRLGWVPVGEPVLLGPTTARNDDGTVKEGFNQYVFKVEVRPSRDALLIPNQDDRREIADMLSRLTPN